MFSLFELSIFLPIELEKRSILNNKIEILIPKEFKEMSREMLDLKYKGKNKPTLVFTDEDGTVNIAFSHFSEKADEKMMEGYKNAFKASFKNSFPNADWKGEGVRLINGRKIGYLRLVTDAIDQKVYNSLFFTHFQGRLLVATFNCTEKLYPKWEKISEEIIESFVVK